MTAVGTEKMLAHPHDETTTVYALLLAVLAAIGAVTASTGIDLLVLAALVAAILAAGVASASWHHRNDAAIAKS